jgi:very-short-patch-repair endonuclease
MTSATPHPKRTQAKSLRKTPVLTERLLWKLLRNRKFAGIKFRRQVPIGRYVADFVCFERRLIVEADGPHHDPDHDIIRDKWLKGRGFQVLRFTNTEVQNNTYAVLDVILAALRWRGATPHPTASPPPSPARGEGMQGEDAVILPSPACAAFDQFPDFEVGG